MKRAFFASKIPPEVLLCYIIVVSKINKLYFIVGRMVIVVGILFVSATKKKKSPHTHSLTLLIKLSRKFLSSHLSGAM